MLTRANEIQSNCSKHEWVNLMGNQVCKKCGKFKDTKGF